MTHVFFHYSHADGLVLDRRGVDVEDMIEAHQRAIGAVRALMSRQGADDWRTWTLHVSDADGDEIFMMPFAYELGRLH